MQISVGGPKSEIESESKKKFITEKEIREILDLSTDSKKLRITKTRIRELLEFYDRIIRSLSLTIKNINSRSQLSNQFRQEKYIKTQERDLSQAKTEKLKLRRYLSLIETKLSES